MGVAYVRNRSPPLRKRECDGRSRHLLSTWGTLRFQVSSSLKEREPDVRMLLCLSREHVCPSGVLGQKFLGEVKLPWPLPSRRSNIHENASSIASATGAWMYELQCKLPSTTYPGQLRLLGALCANWVQAKPHAPKMLQIWCAESTTYPDRLRILGAPCANWVQMPSTISSTPAKNFGRLERKLGATSFDYQFHTG